MPKVTITDSKGLVQSTGKGVVFESAPQYKPQALSALTHAGLTGSIKPGFAVLSASQGGLGTGVCALIPAPSTVPGATLIVRSDSCAGEIPIASKANSNCISGTAGSPVAMFTWVSGVYGDKPSGFPASLGVPIGQRVVMGNDIGSSIQCTSDGNTWIVTSLSGSNSIHLGQAT